MKVFIEQQIIGAIRELLTKRVNEILHDEEFAMPFSRRLRVGGLRSRST
jgi:hypothetical protein